MSTVREILKRRNRALHKLEMLLEQPGTVNVIHYACESFDSPNSRTSPRISAIAVRRMDGGQTDTFSVDLQAKLLGIDPSEIQANFETIERSLLCKFYSYVIMNLDDNWLHWNMRDTTYGFKALANRYRALGQEPTTIPDRQLYGLSSILAEIYGERYANHSKMERMFKLNGISHPDFLSGKNEATAFTSGEFSAIRRSTLRKTDGIEALAKQARRGSLKTDMNLIAHYGILLKIQLIIESVHDYWLFKLLVVLAVIYSAIDILLLVIGLIAA